LSRDVRDEDKSSECIGAADLEGDIFAGTVDLVTLEGDSRVVAVRDADSDSLAGHDFVV
jgi:hypothetical protein